MLGEQSSFVEVLPEEELHEVGVVHEIVEVPGDQFPDLLLRRTPGREGRHLAGFQACIDRAEHLNVEPLLIAKVVVEHPLVAACLADNLVDRHPVVAPLCKEPHARRQQATAGARRIAGPPRASRCAAGRHGISEDSS